MSGRKIIFISAILWCGAFAWAGKETLFGIALVGHVLALFLHNIEMKLNKLLDHYGIVVTDKDLRGG